jgi:hypothetical protein
MSAWHRFEPAPGDAPPLGALHRTLATAAVIGREARPLAPVARRVAIGLLADLELSIGTLRARLRQLEQEAGQARRSGQAMLAYHRTSLLVRR